MREPKDWAELSPRAVFSSPHIFTRRSSAQIMWLVSACLLPAALWGVWLYGWPALRILLLAIFSCTATEGLLNLCTKGSGLTDMVTGRHHLYQNRAPQIDWSLDDGSALLSGLLLGMNLSPLAPWYIPVFGGIFAMAVCKWSFGGLGANWINPALAGRAFVFFSFGREMSYWPVPTKVLHTNPLGWSLPRLADSGLDASTVASPLTVFKEQLLYSGGGADGPFSALDSWAAAMQLHTGQSGGQSGEYSWSNSEALLNLLLGFQGGSIGEVASLLLLLGGLVLLALRIISWHIPLSFLGSFALLTWFFGKLYCGQTDSLNPSITSGFGNSIEELLFHLLSGGLMLGAWFMATDYASSPKMPLAKLIFGIGCGGLSFLIRFYGSYPEGVMLAILFMNIWTPTLDILIRPRVFGSGRQDRQRLKGAKGAKGAKGIARAQKQRMRKLPHY